MTTGVLSARGVVDGRPIFKAYQSRILGPGAIWVVKKVSGLKFSMAFKVVALALLFVANALGLLLFSRESGSWRTGALYTALSAFMFVGLQAQTYLPIWDVIDLSLMLIFAWAVITRAGFAVLIPLYVIALLNREIALFIPLWIVIDAFKFPNGRGRTPGLAARGHAIVGIVLLVGGIVWTQWARNWRFEGAAVEVPKVIETVSDQFWMLPLTFKILLTGAKFDSVVAVVMAMWVMAMIYREWRSGMEHRRKIALLITAMFASIVMFGFITELRIWLSLVPFLLWPLVVDRTVTRVHPEHLTATAPPDSSLIFPGSHG